MTRGSSSDAMAGSAGRVASMSSNGCPVTLSASPPDVKWVARPSANLNCRSSSVISASRVYQLRLCIDSMIEHKQRGLCCWAWMIPGLSNCYAGELYKDACHEVHALLARMHVLCLPRLLVLDNLLSNHHPAGRGDNRVILQQLLAIIAIHTPSGYTRHSWCSKKSEVLSAIRCRCYSSACQAAGHCHCNKQFAETIVYLKVIIAEQAGQTTLGDRHFQPVQLQTCGCCKACTTLCYCT